VLAAGTRNVEVAYADELVEHAVARMIGRDIGRVPVVERAAPQRPIGYFGRDAVMRTLLRRLEEEQVSEPGWLSRGRRMRHDVS
jgi:CBS domain-containing protein